MNQLSFYKIVLSNKIRFAFLKLLSSSNIIVKGSILVHDKTDIEVGRGSTLQIGKGARILQNTALAVRDGATLSIGNGVFINRNSIITARKNISIEDGVTIGSNVCIYDHDHDMRNRGEFLLDNVVIKRNAWIGSNVVVLKGVTIGEEAVIGGGSIVSKNVPDHTILIQKGNSIYKN